MNGAFPGDAASWNRYSYTGGDPINRSDPGGLMWVCFGNSVDGLSLNCPPNAYKYNPLSVDDWDDVHGNGQRIDNPCGTGSLFLPNPWCRVPVVAVRQPPPAPPPSPSCEDRLLATITIGLTGTPLAGEAVDFVNDARNAGLNPILLVAIADAESSLGANVPTGSYNAFGLLRKQGRTYVPMTFSNWNGGIVAAARTVDNEFVNGFVTIPLLYSGAPGAYCVGPGCSTGASNAANEFRSLGGGDPNNPYDLLWPCKD
jgi:hypothetical protein